MVRGEGLSRWGWGLVVIAIACKEAKVVKKAVTGVEPQILATVITIQTNLQPQNKSFTHTIVIADGHARSSDEVDHWRLFDLDNDRVTFVDDLSKTYYTQTIGGAPPTAAAHTGEVAAAPQVIATSAKRVIQGVEATQYVIRLGGYQRELWIGIPPAIPPKLFGMMNATDDALSKLRGFPLIDQAELPYGKARLVVEKSVVRIDQRRVAKSWLNVGNDYREIKAPDERRPPAWSPPPGRSTRATG